MSDYKPLTLKYRPKSLDDVVGQGMNSKVIQKMVETNKIPSTVIFLGSRGTGKTSSARIVAKMLNCESEDKPCGECASCKAIESGNSVDVLEIDAASHGNVSDIRELKQAASFVTPGSYKVIILDEAHSLSREAWNALLKLIEEPPEHVLFILASTEVEKIPDTIISRAVNFEFSRITSKSIYQRLAHICDSEGFDYEEEALHLISRSVAGGMRDAVSMLDQSSIFGDGNITVDVVRDLLGLVSFSFVVDFIETILAGDLESLFSKIEELYAVYSPNQFIEEVGGVLLDALYVKFGVEVDRNEEDHKVLMELMPKVSTKEILFLLREFSGIQQELKKSALYGKNLFTAFLLRICEQLGKITGIEEEVVKKQPKVVASVKEKVVEAEEEEPAQEVDVAAMLSNLL